MEELYCIGCGAKLQTEKENEEGYVAEKALNRENVLCKRCFQLKHYGKFQKIDNIIDPISLLKKQATKKDLLIILMDACMLYSPINQDYRVLKDYPNKIIIFNRFDLIKDYTNINKLKEYLKKHFSYLKTDKIFVLDDNIQEIFEYIDNHTVENNAYLLGNENVGKTTFINLILKAVAEEKNNFLISSYFPGTTLKQIKIPLTDDNFLIDLPGIKRNECFLNYVENKIIKSIVTSKKISAFSYQLKECQSFVIHNYLIFDYLNNDSCQLVFYIPNLLKIKRCKPQNALNNFYNMDKMTILTTKEKNDLQTYEFSLDKDENVDIVIEGLLFIRIFKKGLYRIRTFKGINVHQRKSIF